MSKKLRNNSYILKQFTDDFIVIFYYATRFSKQKKIQLHKNTRKTSLKFFLIKN